MNTNYILNMRFTKEQQKGIDALRLNSRSHNSDRVFDKGWLRPLLPDVKKVGLLTEVYSKTDRDSCLIVVLALKKKLLGHLSESEFNSVCEHYHFVLNSFESDIPAIKAAYNSKTRNIEIDYSTTFERDLKLCAEYEIAIFVDHFWTNVVHEDTHKQQTDQIKDKEVLLQLGKHYVKFSSLNVEDPQNLPYFNQNIEADAYGREIASRLQSIYKNFTADDIFELINKNEVLDDYSNNIISAYKSPKMSRKNTQRFFRALYDFLDGNEK